MNHGGGARRGAPLKNIKFVVCWKYVMEHEADLWGDDACHRPVGLSALQLSKLYHAVLCDGGAVPRPGRMPGTTIIRRFCGFSQKIY